VMWEIKEVLGMKVREFKIQAWDRNGTKLIEARTRDRVEMLHELDRQTQRTDMDVAQLRVDIKIVEQNDTEIST
jgi:hypothetical protein